MRPRGLVKLVARKPSARLCRRPALRRSAAGLRAPHLLRSPARAREEDSTRRQDLMLATIIRICAVIGLSFAVALAMMARGTAADDGTAAVAPDKLPSFAPMLKKIAPAVVKVEIR